MTREQALAEVGNFPITSVPCTECGSGPGSCCWNNDGVTAFHTQRVLDAIAERDGLNDWPQPTDTRETIIAVGARVAYNISGEVAEGNVQAISAKPNPRQWGPRWHYTFKVRLNHSAAGKGKGHVSKVTDPHNLLVLEDVH